MSMLSIPNASDGMLTLTSGSMKRSSENFTSSAVTGSPLLNMASRRWNVHVRPSDEDSQLSAIPGPTSGSVSGSASTRVLKICTRAKIEPLSAGAERVERLRLEVARHDQRAPGNRLAGGLLGRLRRLLARRRRFLGGGRRRLGGRRGLGRFLTVAAAACSGECQRPDHEEQRERSGSPQRAWRGRCDASRSSSGHPFYAPPTPFRRRLSRNDSPASPTTAVLFR